MTQQQKIGTRDQWLKSTVSAMSSWYEDLGFPLPEIEVQTGFPSSGQRGQNVAESWSLDNGESYVVVVRPDVADPLRIAAAVAHQLCFVAVGQKDQHGHLFRHVAISIGLRGTKAERTPGEVFKELVRPILEDLGPLPSSIPEPAAPKGSSKQTTRMIKVSCNECGYVARVSRKWIEDVGPPLCPLHGAMTPEL